MCRLKCPTKGDVTIVTNGYNGTIGANGANVDPFETMMIQIGQIVVPIVTMVPMATMVSITTMVPMATLVKTIPMVIVATLAPMATMTMYRKRL